MPTRVVNMFLHRKQGHMQKPLSQPLHLRHPKTKTPRRTLAPPQHVPQTLPRKISSLPCNKIWPWQSNGLLHNLSNAAFGETSSKPSNKPSLLPLHTPPNRHVSKPPQPLQPTLRPRLRKLQTTQSLVDQRSKSLILQWKP